MPYSSDTPYVILNVSPSSSPEDLNKARDRAVRQRAFPLPRIMQAYNELRNPRKRTEVDLLIITDLGDERELEQILDRIPPYSFMDMPVNILISHLMLLNFDRLIPEETSMNIPVNPFNFDAYQSETNLSLLPVNLPLPD